ncbi:PIR protein [Plasmodium vivax]|uniref:VIR protein n=1 Tax=Plasmodium vivax TaxID=5855 RepID=A0A564ZT93_PLAVI|nr:PIR protein [Plasmodium vivax]
MAQCQGHTGDYFNYACYHRLRDYYDIKHKTESCINFRKQYTVPSIDKNINVSSYTTLIDDLVNRLSSNALSFDIDNSITCKYINYWLNEEILNKYSMLYGLEFDIFQECADKYAIFKNGLNVYEANSCRKYINSLYDGKYNKMKSLYDLYKWYKQIEQPNRVNDNLELCKTLNVITYNYREMSSQFKEDEKLCKKLNEFKNLTMNNKTLFKDRCNIDISQSMPTPTILLPKVEPPVKEKENLALQDTLRTPQGNELQHSADETRQNLGSRLTEGPGSHPEQSHVDISQTKESAEAVSESEQLPPLGSRRERAQTLSPQETVLQYTVFPEVGNGLKMERGLSRDPKSDTFEERNDTVHEKMIPHATGGFSGAIKDAFSTISENVDPVPLMGVSGGMGALFLLFRYTPVGAFFRGGRGRVRRIPSAFHGQFPGGFPGYEEYDGGYIGYSQMSSLAE